MAEIGFDHGGVVADRLRQALGDPLAVIHDDDAVRQAHHHLQLVFDQQNGQTAALEVVHHFLLGATGGFLTVEGDPDGEAEDAAWIPVAELNGVLAYPNERRLAEAALVVLVGEE